MRTAGALSCRLRLLARREAKEAERRRYSTQQRLESAEEAVHELTDKVAQLNAELLVDVQGGSGAAPP